MLDLKNITSNNMNSLTEENYLKAIFHLLDSENQVTVNELSKFLQIKMPSVNSMMKNMNDLLLFKILFILYILKE